MSKTIIHALDFDGVICDSAVETGITGWKAATHLWDDMQSSMAPTELIAQFRQVRPIIETGYEAILAMRLLFQGQSVTTVLAEFTNLKQQTLSESGCNSIELKKLFGEIRDTWITEALDQWVEMNPLFSGVTEKLQALNKQGLWYIITTKQERFVTRILHANGIDLPEERIFGLDRKMSKVEVLSQLLTQHPQARIHFIEDRLPTLVNVLAAEQLKPLELYFATWGYNTTQEKLLAKTLAVKSIAALGEF